MKKSCSDKGSKVVTTQDAENVLNGSKHQREHLTEEQLKINQKLLESGIEETGLGWLEKRNIFKTINVSLDAAGSERLRSSPRLSKSVNVKPEKWVENSFERPKHEESAGENSSKAKKESESNSTSKKLTPIQKNQRQCQESEESTQKSQQKQKTGGKLQRDGEALQFDSPKSSKQVHYIKIELEDNPKEEHNSVAEASSPGVSLGKKRTSQPETGGAEAPKKIKMEENSNGVYPEEESPLEVELELEKRKQNAPYKIRDIKTIVSECDIRNRKWKETFLKYKCPTRWGIPIVKNCSEKWDGKQIPPKLLHRYQKYLSSNNLTHPVYLPVKSQSSADLNNLASEISSKSNTSGNGECRDESGSDFKHLEEGSFAHGDSGVSGLENNLNASTSATPPGRMVLRSRSQQKTVISDDEFSSDDSEDWLVQQKSSKKQKFNAKNKKAADQSNKHLVLKLEKCNINRGNGNEGGRRNGNKNDSNFTGGPILSSGAVNQSGGSTKPGPDPDTMVCPICSLRFKKQHIEAEARLCRLPASLLHKLMRKQKCKEKRVMLQNVLPKPTRTEIGPTPPAEI